MTNFLHYPQTFKWVKCLISNMYSKAPRGQIKKVMIFACDWFDMDWYDLVFGLALALFIHIQIEAIKM